ncbi:hypothetical protein HN51_031184 [Arachis hypogaea]|uniref:Uncharacterized protein LOC107469385 isoform X1 n=1 Tax=Arachis duranensis TaxID=130453 RepID=A0A6P4BQV2_ARADU|nr:uncharacterized protein LOC107469385 isoform X1 [Arachis duranensis]XP_020988560.1 uncharacterized protein LOC107469385 isoform X1 [Arachis duranensis]XP_025622875.1 probable inactive serine/threonine-protein kinase bub1 isoform X1 [Arachis hypogaea]XP_029145458.1 probable inactive serine/threonine-protein kinase bub1 isoform X1 [Arachis hypogaea]QHO15767.1 Mitotic spindle checkpoint protein [Arachis hypogaea]
MSHEGMLSSIINEASNYTGKDPLLPWLRGIRKMKDSFAPEALKEKLPVLLQKCAQKFQLDRRYRNDMRYLRVWLHLMDFVDDPGELLRTMEANHIGTKRCQFYQAYALFYEKSKKYDEAERMYHLGVKNLAEPMDELQKSYDQFLQRMERRKNKRNNKQEVRGARRALAAKGNPSVANNIEGSSGACSVEGVQKGPQVVSSEANDANDRNVRNRKDECKRVLGENTVVVSKFVDTAIVGKSEAEDACHHGLVDPTINMKEAMNAINSMFRAPLETVPVPRKSQRNQLKEDRSMKNGFEVFVDENLDNGMKPTGSSQKRTEASQPPQELLQIYVDDEGFSETSDVNANSHEDSTSSASQPNGLVFPHPKDLPSEKSSDRDEESSHKSKFREDTVVCRFVGSAILDEPEVENVCHHGLVDPTINMKEAMNDINNMFGKPMDFVRKKRSMKLEKAPEINRGKELDGFSILADDDDMEQQQVAPPPKFSRKSKECELYEPTIHTKEAMDNINKMFNMPLDF